jgi:hypothetical protein
MKFVTGPDEDQLTFVLKSNLELLILEFLPFGITANCHIRRNWKAELAAQNGNNSRIHNSKKFFIA